MPPPVQTSRDAVTDGVELLAHEALAEVPMILEIPPGRDDVLVRRALNRLRRWQKQA
jgi:hypothetical protein